MACRQLASGKQELEKYLIHRLVCVLVFMPHTVQLICLTRLHAVTGH